MSLTSRASTSRRLRHRATKAEGQKGYKMSAATKAKLRAAWKRRRGAARTVAAGARAAKAGAKAFVRGKRKKAVDSGGVGVGNG